MKKQLLTMMVITQPDNSDAGANGFKAAAKANLNIDIKDKIVVTK